MGLPSPISSKVIPAIFIQYRHLAAHHIEQAARLYCPEHQTLSVFAVPPVIRVFMGFLHLTTHIDQSHQVAYLTPIIGAAGAGFAVGLTTTGAIAGRLIVGLFVDRIGFPLLHRPTADRTHESYGFVRTISWAIPIIGFLGTVMGITVAIANITPEQLDTSIGAVTGGLALAFDTTALSLTLSLVIVFAYFVVERADDDSVAIANNNEVIRKIEGLIGADEG
jgi:hypothetical protein